MRKRADVVQDDSPPESEPRPRSKREEPESDAKQPTLPLGVWVEDGMLFLACPTCNLFQSAKTAKRPKGTDDLKCFRCEAALDYDVQGGLGEENIVKLEEYRSLGMPMRAKNKSSEKKAEPPPPKEEEAKKCSECNSKMTQTALGFFCPQGHDDGKRTASAIEPKIPPKASAPEPVKEAPKEFKKPNPTKDRIDPDLRVSYETSETVRVGVGKETFSPKRDNFFAVPEMETTTRLRDGETMTDAALRAHTELEKLQEILFQKKLKTFMQHLEKVTEAME